VLLFSLLFCLDWRCWLILLHRGTRLLSFRLSVAPLLSSTSFPPFFFSLVASVLPIGAQAISWHVSLSFCV
jgi:hypothetical protein